MKASLDTHCEMSISRSYLHYRSCVKPVIIRADGGFGVDHYDRVQE